MSGKDMSQMPTYFSNTTLGRAPDAVFTSENYGDLYAALMGSKHILVDRERLLMPIADIAELGAKTFRSEFVQREFQ
jgi:hypothetical protein